MFFPLALTAAAALFGGGALAGGEQQQLPKEALSCEAILARYDADQQQQQRSNAGGDAVIWCKLYELADAVVEGGNTFSGLGDHLMNGIAYMLMSKGITPSYNGGDKEKRKHEILRFGKRKHEILRFGKRKHKYLHFGKRKYEYLRFGK